MTEPSEIVAPAAPVSFLSGIELKGDINIDTTALVENINAAIRLGYPQVWRTGGMNPGRVAIVGGGPSLNQTEAELVQLYHEGAKVIALNGAARWLMERNIRPSAHIILDGRPGNASFVLDAEIPQCRYYLASQVHPDVWARVSGFEHVAIFHDAGDASACEVLDRYYLKHWQGVPGGTTVGTRAIGLMRMLGFLRFDMFGFDSCWMDGQHHAYAQEQNAQEAKYTLTIQAGDDSTEARTFSVAPWHLKQLDDLLLFIRSSGNSFMLNIHGDGLLAYALRAGSQMTATVNKQE